MKNVSTGNVFIITHTITRSLLNFLVWNRDSCNFQVTVPVLAAFLYSHIYAQIKWFIFNDQDFPFRGLLVIRPNFLFDFIQSIIIYLAVIYKIKITGSISCAIFLWILKKGHILSNNVLWRATSHNKIIKFKQGT